MYDIPDSLKIENKSEKLKSLKSTSWLFIPIESIILLILSNEYVAVNIILLCCTLLRIFLATKPEMS
ncbi:MAG: hypothetical protein ACXWEW_04495 [Nitrososphaeraceae archaeon]